MLISYILICLIIVFGRLCYLWGVQHTMKKKLSITHIEGYTLEQIKEMIDLVENVAGPTKQTAKVLKKGELRNEKT